MVDTGPDGFLGRRPEALDLCQRDSVSETPSSRSPAGGAGVWARGRVRPLPDGLALGIPTRFWPSARSGILGLRGPARPGPRRAAAPGPTCAGPSVTAPSVPWWPASWASGWSTGWWTRSSAASTPARWTTCRPPPPTPRSWRRPRSRGSLMRALRAEVPPPDADAPPLFWALDGGMASLVERLRTTLRGTRGGDPLRHAGRARWNGTAAAVGRCDQPADGHAAIEADARRASAAPGAGGPPAARARTTTRRRPPRTHRLRLGDPGHLAGAAATRWPSPLAGTGFLVPRRSPRARAATPGR